MNRRINKKTGYPMSTDEQIKLAKLQIDLSDSALNNPQKYKNITDNHKQLDFIVSFSSNTYYLGNYFYKCGDWDRAEMEWLKLIYLMPKAIRSLAILYKKEKRYQDIIEVYKESLHSVFIDKYYKGNEISLGEIALIKKYYNSHVAEDVSSLSKNDFDHLKNISPFPTT